MGATYTRQSTYTDGDTITAAHTNDEFDQLLAAFASSTGHTHDGTTAEGGAITKLLGNTLTFGAGTAGTDITITYDGETNQSRLHLVCRLLLEKKKGKRAQTYHENGYCAWK